MICRNFLKIKTQLNKIVLKNYTNDTQSINQQDHQPQFKRVALILSGLGNETGTDLYDAVSLMVNLNNLGVNVNFYSLPDQMIESSRISRGKINDLSTLKPSEYQGIFLPGGNGVATNLTNYREKNEEFQVNEILENALIQFHQDKKPIVTLGLAGIIAAKVFIKYSPRLTLGKQEQRDDGKVNFLEQESIKVLEKLGAIHVDRFSNNFQIDFENRIISTPASLFNGFKRGVHTFECAQHVTKIAQQFFLGNQIRMSDYKSGQYKRREEQNMEGGQRNYRRRNNRNQEDDQQTQEQ
ncbi:isoprenoid biosynthesis protein, putative [Ichthyophthirius multifiliis]|uniref:Isoprenoid biosynthesis protein, putative n=1 Tax=Ichthyophthirius multifiliis TaxID=5932 RepID=G0QRV9_ICHMU|nr:isoprenoid biosynthesis protein, putative [Ichthyophthirius multifiliis]EGR32050.1 isoprenoid biosynthesis protein, putative [Ichthyophthirius multifiliis]|eukprot:XP_004035536.1 isoprenoid biosynthesis protein, putative [Ichthyophthirius multifiliis]